jgi:hypothetical protein
VRIDNTESDRVTPAWHYAFLMTANFANVAATSNEVEWHTKKLLVHIVGIINGCNES